MWRRLPYVAGAALIGVGLGGLVLHSSDTHPVGWLLWFAGAAVVHDALFAPFVLGVAALAGRAPRPPVVRAGLAVAGAAAIVALPAVLAYGRRPDNPSVLPQAYGLHLVTIIGVVTAAVVVANAYAPPMGKAILTVVGVLLSIWLIFMVIGMIISALKFLIWLGFLAVIGAVIVILISKMAKST
jgi:hypothetical protein